MSEQQKPSESARLSQEEAQALIKAIEAVEREEAEQQTQSASPDNQRKSA